VVRPFRSITGAAALAATLLCAFSGAPPPASPRLVLLYATCSLNRDYLSPYDEHVFFTPNLGRFAREAAVFRSHQNEAGLSGTDFAAIFSGVQADDHGVFSHPRKLEDDLFLIFEAFRRAGFDTFYWAGHPMATAALNYGQGVPASNVFARPLTAADEDFRSVLNHLRRDSGYRALVVTAFTVTHGPYRIDNARALEKAYPKETAGISDADLRHYHTLYKENFVPLQTRFDETVRRLSLSQQDVSKLAAVLKLAYEGGVHLLDALFGAVWRTVGEYGLDRNSVIAFTADHGETLYAKDRRFKWTHAPDLQPEVITVPLMIRWPAVVRPRAIHEVTRSIDVYPTLAGLARVALPREAGVRGQDLSASLRGERPVPRLRAYSHGTLRQWSFFVPDVIENTWAAERVGDRLYTWRPEGSRWLLEVQDLGKVGGEASSLDLSDPESRAVAANLRDYHERLMAAYRNFYPEEARSKEEALGRISEEHKEVLKSLGYIE
jgi:arylsulfatase A-like enzyme